MKAYSKLIKLPPLLMAALLQIAPFCRSVFVNPGTIQSSFAVVFRWVAGTGVTLGAIDAVSGASATITGLKPYVGTTVIGPTSLTPSIPAGANNITLRIIVANPGTDHTQDYWNCTPLPSGLTINTNFGANGYITNIPAQLTVAGTYYVTLLAGNQNFGYITTNATITVTNATSSTPPTIATQPSNQTANEGGSVTFTVVANDNGSPPLSYQWRKHSATAVGTNGPSFTINPVSTNDADFYDVVVTTSGGTKTSNPATLTVIAKPTIQTPPASQTVNVGGTVTFTVTAGGTAPFSYQWYKGGTTPVGTDSPTYSINPVGTGDAGSYTVKVTNAAGSITSAAATLTVNGPPVIQTPPVSQTAYVGGSVTFTVGATGSGTLSYQWQRGGTTSVGTNGPSFTISPVSLTDQNTYNVVVSNSAGPTPSTSATLSVVQPPSVGLTLDTQQPATGPKTVSWQGIAGKSYTLQRRDNFSPDVWHDVGNTNVTTTGVVTMTDSTSAGINIRFYQILSQ